MKTPDYLSDAQLTELIASVEQHAMLTAPDYLKDTIIQKAAKKEQNRRRELLFYGLKTALATAAAIAMLFFTPEFKLSPAGESSFLRAFNQKTSQFCSLVSDSTNYLFQNKEDFRYDK